MTPNPLSMLLHEYRHLPAEYRDGMTNHLPMALHALSELGADAARMQAFAAGYARRFEPRMTAATSPTAALPPGAWRALRGQPDSGVALHGHFSARLEAQGLDATLRQVLPDLWSGVAAAAFHGLIRTAHAVQSGAREEQAQALAYWAWRWQPTRAPDVTQPLLSATDWTAALQLRAGTWRSPRGLISQRLEDVQATAPYIELAGRLDVDSVDLPTALRPLATFAAERYAASRNLTVLHMLTACRAARVLAPWLQDSAGQRRLLAQAYAAAYLGSGIGALPAPPAAAAGTWPEVVAAAIASDDDHVIKVVHACREAETAWGAGPWLAAATRAVRVP